MIIAPKDNDPKKKTVNSKEYWWCPRHSAWTRHAPADCRGQGIKPKGENPPNPVPQGQQDKQLKLANALATLIEEDKDEYDTHDNE